MLCSASLCSSWTNSGDGGGGFSTATWAVTGVLRPRASVQFALTVIGPGETPVVFRVAVLALPAETFPPLAVQLPTVTGTLSGLVQGQLIVEDEPACTAAGSAEHATTGGCFGGSLTMKLAVQLVSPPLFTLGSEMWAVTV